VAFQNSHEKRQALVVSGAVNLARNTLGVGRHFSRNYAAGDRAGVRAESVGAWSVRGSKASPRSTEKERRTEVIFARSPGARKSV
jgi:hypothetical protein